MTQIRRAQPRDAGEIAQLHVATWRTAYTGILPDTMLLGMSPAAEQRQWSRLIATTDHQFAVHVAEAEDGRLRGYGSAGSARPSGLPFAGEVYTLYVTPDHQGQNLGRRLLFAMFAQLRAQGFGSALVWVLAANPSRFFYHAMGGALAAERRERHFGAMLDEQAYGWPDLETLCHLADSASQGKVDSHE